MHILFRSRGPIRQKLLAAALLSAAAIAPTPAAPGPGQSDKNFSHDFVQRLLLDDHELAGVTRIMQFPVRVDF